MYKCSNPFDIKTNTGPLYHILPIGVALESSAAPKWNMIRAPWEPEGRRFKSLRGLSTECGLVSGEVLVGLLVTAEVPLEQGIDPPNCSLSAI